MNYISLSLFIIFFKVYSFVELDIVQEYETICQSTDQCCQEIHEKYVNCGRSIFHLWLLLDLLQSIHIKDLEYDFLCSSIMVQIVFMYETIFDLFRYKDEMHQSDLDNILYFVNKLSIHPVILSTDFLVQTILLCEKVLKKIIE